jgi:hypothetical protein
MDVYVVTEEVHPPYCDDVYHNIIGLYGSKENALKVITTLEAAEKERTGPKGWTEYDWELHIMEEDQ